MDDAAREGIKGESKHRDRQFTSRISVKHVVNVIEGFSEFKRWLVEEIPSSPLVSVTWGSPQPHGRKRRK